LTNVYTHIRQCETFDKTVEYLTRQVLSLCYEDNRLTNPILHRHDFGPKRLTGSTRTPCQVGRRDHVRFPKHLGVILDRSPLRKCKTQLNTRNNLLQRVRTMRGADPITHGTTVLALCCSADEHVRYGDHRYARVIRYVSVGQRTRRIITGRPKPKVTNGLHTPYSTVGYISVEVMSEEKMQFQRKAFAANGNYIIETSRTDVETERKM